MTTTHPAAAGTLSRRQWASGVGALLTLLVLLVAIPAVLITLAGIPFTHGLPSASHLLDRLRRPDDGQLLLDVLVVVAWAGWAAFTVSVAAETLALARRTVAPAVFGLGALQPFAGRLLASAALLLPAATVLPLAAPTPQPQPPAAAPLRPAAGPGRPALPAVHPPAVVAPAVPATTAGAVLPVYVVGTDATGQRDTLWSIAERHLGDPLRWNQIAHLNYGQQQPDGAVFTDPNLIRPGWQLRLPADATGLSRPQPAATGDAPLRVVPQPPAQRLPTPPQLPPLPPVPPPIVAPPERPAPTATPATPTPASSTPAGQPEPTPAGPSAASRTEHPSAGLLRIGVGSEIGEALAAALLAALALRRLRRRQRYRLQRPQPARLTGHPPVAPPLRQLIASTPAATSDKVADDDFFTAVRRGGSWGLGVRQDRPVTVAWRECPILCLTGAGAPDVARAVLAAVFTALPGTVEVLVVGDVLTELLPGFTPAAGVQQVGDLQAAHDRLQLEVLSRTRHLADNELPDATAYRACHPEDPFPALLLLTKGPLTPKPQLVALLHGNAALDIAALVITEAAATPAAGLLEASADGTVISAQPAALADQVADARLYRLTAGDAVTLLRATAPGDTDDPAEPIDVEPPAVEWAGPARQATSRPAIRVQLLGHIRLWVDGSEVTTGLRQAALQLLAWYLLHPDGRPIDAATDAIWPDIPAKRGTQRFWNALGNLRTRLRETAGDPTLQILRKTNGVYRPQPEAFDVDLWAFQTGLQQAATTAVPREKIDALTAATTTYTGPFLAYADYLWADPIREEIHRRALDAHAKLADLLAVAGDAERAIATLERALELDPYGEDIYRRLMRLQHQSGRTESVRLLWKQLNIRLADLDCEPDDETRRLYRECMVSVSAAAEQPRVLASDR